MLSGPGASSQRASFGSSRDWSPTVTAASRLENRSTIQKSSEIYVRTDHGCRQGKQNTRPLQPRIARRQPPIEACGYQSPPVPPECTARLELLLIANVRLRKDPT